MGFWDSFIGPKVNSFLPSCVERNGITVSKTTRDAKEPAWGRLHIYTESLAFSENDLQTCEWNVSSILRKSKFCESVSTDLRLSELRKRPLVTRTVDVNVPCSTEWIWLTTSLSDEALGPELDSLISSRQYTIPDCETWMLGAHPIRNKTRMSTDLAAICRCSLPRANALSKAVRKSTIKRARQKKLLYYFPTRPWQKARKNPSKSPRQSPVCISASYRPISWRLAYIAMVPNAKERVQLFGTFMIQWKSFIIRVSLAGKNTSERFAVMGTERLEVMSKRNRVAHQSQRAV